MLCTDGILFGSTFVLLKMSAAIILLYIIALYKQPQNSQFGTLLVGKNVAAIVKPECVQRAIIIIII